MMKYNIVRSGRFPEWAVYDDSGMGIGNILRIVNPDVTELKHHIYKVNNCVLGRVYYALTLKDAKQSFKMGG